MDFRRKQIQCGALLNKINNLRNCEQGRFHATRVSLVNSSLLRTKTSHVNYIHQEAAQATVELIFQFAAMFSARVRMAEIFSVPSHLVVREWPFQCLLQKAFPIPKQLSFSAGTMEDGGGGGGSFEETVKSGR